MKPRYTSGNGGSEEIKANIEETRAQMDETLDELSERLRPRHILDDLLDYFRSRRGSARPGERRARMKRAASRVREKTGDAGRAAAYQVREHPLPTLLIGAGLSLLLWERYREDDYGEEFDEDDYSSDYADESTFSQVEVELSETPGPEGYALPQHYSSTESSSSGIMNKMKEKGAQMKERASQRLHRMKNKAGDRFQDIKHRTAERGEALRQRAGEKGAQLKEQAHHTYEQGIDAFKRTADERPLAVGLGFLALGVVAGLLLPSTRKEDELVGPTRDRLVKRSREVAEDAVARGKEVARATVDAASSEAKAQGLAPEMLKEKAQAVVARTTETARQETERHSHKLRDELKQS